MSYIAERRDISAVKDPKTYKDIKLICSWWFKPQSNHFVDWGGGVVRRKGMCP